MQLRLLQSRLAASLTASSVVLILYLLLVSLTVAVASELPFGQVVHVGELVERSEASFVSYEPDFALFDRSIIGRAPTETTSLTNNGPEALNLDAGSTACYKVDKDTIFGNAKASRGTASDDIQSRKENGGKGSSDDTPTKTIYISANTCLQPNRVSPDATTMDPPQLSLFVTNSSDVGCPDPSKGLSEVEWKVFDEGAVKYSMNTTGDIYIGISAPKISKDFKGVWNFEVAVSTDDYYHQYDSQANSELLWMDSDSSSVLLVTRNLTQNHSDVQKVMDAPLPYELFVENNSSRTLNGLRHSVCGLEKHAQISVHKDGSGNLNSLVRTGMTTRGPGSLPKQQFYFMGLNSSSSYTGILVKTAPGVSGTKRQSNLAGGGGTVFKATQFKTSSGTNCKVVTDLEFCDEIQYAVPGNGERYNNTALAKVYDDYAKKMYGHFQTVLKQIPCENRPESSYSLARNCYTCQQAYKRWLCTVSVPRCEDFSGGSMFGIPRNVGQPFPNGSMLPEDERKQLERRPFNNASRNKFIDETIQPGPYKELLPCEDVCYEVVQSCPAAIGFKCPQPYMPSFNVSYGTRDRAENAVSCNYPGEARTKFSSAHVPFPAQVALGVIPLAMAWIV